MKNYIITPFHPQYKISMKLKTVCKRKIYSFNRYFIKVKLVYNTMQKYCLLDRESLCEFKKGMIKFSL